MRAWVMTLGALLAAAPVAHAAGDACDVRPALNRLRLGDDDDRRLMVHQAHAKSHATEGAGCWSIVEARAALSLHDTTTALAALDDARARVPTLQDAIDTLRVRALHEAARDDDARALLATLHASNRTRTALAFELAPDAKPDVVIAACHDAIKAHSVDEARDPPKTVQAPTGQVRDVRDTAKRHEVVRAHAVDRDAANEHQVLAWICEATAEHLRGRLLVAPEQTPLPQLAHAHGSVLHVRAVVDTARGKQRVDRRFKGRGIKGTGGDANGGVGCGKVVLVGHGLLQ